MTFKANLIIDNKDSSFIEKNKFIKKDGRWFYLDGEII